MKNLFSSLVIIAVLSMTLSLNTQAQRSMQGLPQSSLVQDLPLQVDFRQFEAPDMAVIEAEDLADPTHYRAAVAVPVNLNIDNSGEWTELPDGGKIWRLKLEVKGALALGVYYDNFWLPYGGELYVYNEDKTQIIGAYTQDNNNPDCMFANQLVQGDVVTLEYYQPAAQSIEPLISISELAYAYRGVYFESSPERSGSLWCMINVNCSPEGDNWQDEKKGVVKQLMKIGFNYYFCSGTLINNTEQDLTPYVLTAHHCGEGATASDMNQWIFYFNYEAATCTGTWGPANNTMTGCDLKAQGGLFPGSDFLLIELKYNVPVSYDPYFNGWDRTNIGADSGVNLHHPAGDIKKVTSFNIQATSSQWNGNGILSHWKIYYQTTPHGTSITEGGSSGSPLFNQDGQVVGDLTGGPQDDCDNPAYSLYGKVYWSWDKVGVGINQRLKPWLDPGNYGPEKWDGIYTGLEPIPDFSADQTVLQVGESVLFTDMTTGNPLEWEWTFEGGTPGTYTGISPPPITYNTAGKYDVSLTASNTLGGNTKDSTEMIIVGAPAADFSATNTYLHSGETVDFTDETTGDPVEWEWTFTGGTPETSTEQNPTAVQYNAQGSYDVKLIAVNQYGSDTITKEEYVTVDGPFADFEADLTSIEVGQSVTFTDLTINDPTTWSWKFFGGSPGSFSGQNPPSITYNAVGDYDIKLTVSNALGTDFLTKTDYIHVGSIGIGENEAENQLKVYPNPSQGTIILEMTELRLAGAMVDIVNARGEVVYHKEVTSDTDKLSIDLNHEPAGIYMVRVQINEKTINKKLTLIK